MTKEEIIKEIAGCCISDFAAESAADKIIDLINQKWLTLYSENEIDFAYLTGVFNVSGIDGLHAEIKRLNELKKLPHDIIKALRS